MIRHICMFKLKEDKEKNIQEFIERAQALKDMPMLRHFEVVSNYKEAPESNYDVSLIFDFDSMDDLNAYQTAPLHVEFGKFVGTVKEERACIDYEF
ncbi:MAG: Dabb family protein [Lachnospiraceae bacterium]|nr:Dabb family protein [Lachnospiraceae bacterium]